MPHAVPHGVSGLDSASRGCDSLRPETTVRRSILRVAIIIAAVGLLLCGSAQAQLWGDWTADNLRSGCAPMHLEVQLAGRSEGDDGLRQRLGDAAESRLRSARLFADRSYDQVLRISVLATAPRATGEPDVASVALSLYRWTANTGYGRPGTSIVWQGIAIGGFNDVRSLVGNLVDRFLTEYLRANPGL